MNLRKEFDDIIAQYGYPILLVRQSKQVRCSCWNEKNQEADRECPVCYGLGRVPIIEKHYVRDMDTSVPETLTRLVQKGEFGEMAMPGRVYYFRYNAPVSTGDLIVDVDWTPGGKPIYTGRGIYEVNHVDPQQFQRGEVVFYKVYVKDQPIEKEIRSIRITQANGIRNYEIVGR